MRHEGVRIPTSDPCHDPTEWAGMMWDLVAGVVEWQLQQGYAINSLNTHLATVKTYCQLACALRRPASSLPAADVCPVPLRPRMRKEVVKR